MALLRALTTAALLLCRAQSCEDAGGCEHEESSLLQRGTQNQLAQLERCRPSTPGIFWTLDGEAKHAADLTGWQPLDVPNRSRLDLLVCNVGHMAVSGSRALQGALPALVGSVGAGARVRVGVQDSFNVALAGNLSLEDGGSLVPTVVQGRVLPGARVSVQLSGSGNVKGTGSLEVLGASLLAAVLADDLEGSQVEVTIKGCGNVGADEVRLDNASAALLMPVVAADGIQASTLSASLADSGNVRGGVLALTAGQLLEALVRVSTVAASKLELYVQGAGQFKGTEVEISGGSRLLRGLVGAESGNPFESAGTSVESTSISGKIRAAARLHAENVSLSSSELLTTALDLAAVTGGVLTVAMADAANVRCSNFRMSGGDLLQEAVRTREAFTEQTQVQVSLTKVASLDVGDAEIRGSFLSMVVQSDTGMINGSMDVKLEEVGCVRGQTVRFAGGGRFADDILDQQDPSEFNQDSKVSVSIVQSFNFHVTGDLTFDGNDLFPDVIDMSFERCEVSVKIQDSLKNWVGGDMLQRDDMIDDLHRGEVRNSTYHLEVLNSLTVKVQGNFEMQSFARMIEDVFNGDIEVDSQVSISIVESALAEVQGNVSISGSSNLLQDCVDDEVVNSAVVASILKSGNIVAQGDVSIVGSEIFEDLIADPIRNSSLTLVVKESANVRGRRIFFGNGELIEDVMDDRSENAKISIKFEDSAQVVAETDVVMQNAQIVGEVLEGFEHVNTTFTFVANDFGTVVAGGSVSLEASSMVRELSSASTMVGSTALFKLERAFTVEAEKDFSQVSAEDTPEGLVNVLVRSTRLTEGSDVTIAAEHSVNVKAEAVAMNSSRVVGTGVFVDTFANSSVTLKLQDTAGVEAKRAVLRNSSLLGALFRPSSSWENARLRVELDDAASLEEAEEAVLVGSSLLGSLGSLDGMELSMHESALVICDGEGPLLTLENSTFCEDGAAALRAVAKPFKESCKAQSCRQT